MQRAHLVMHQRDQRRHHDGAAMSQPLPCNRRHLIAQRLATARRHQHQRIATAHHRVDDGLLLSAEGGVAEDLLQDGDGRMAGHK